MEDYLPAITAFIVYVSPVGFALAWARFSAVSRVRRSMIRNAKVVVITISALFLLNYSAEFLCDGSVIKGFVRCAFFPLFLAKLVMPISLFSIGAIAAWLMWSIVVSGWAEFAHFRKPNDAG